MELPVTPRRNCAIAALAAMLLATSAADAAVGRTPGFASVSDDGEAVYSIPLDLPPGTNGLTPTLSLDYRHRARGGLLGVGWSVGGLSQITRCAKTIAQDGVAAPASRSPDTRFCLDGQRLVVVSGTFYNQPNAEYRTEIESFARIRAVAGTIDNGPAHFVVEGLDGRIYEYGATADSSIDGRSTAPAGGARTWALSRMRDRSGNVIDYRYTEESASTAFRIASIRYNANPSRGVTASHEIAFSYATRPSTEVDAGYHAGMPVRHMMRLSRIDVLHGAQVLRRYELAYEPMLSSGGRSRLASVKECGAGGSDCFAPTVFKWQDGEAGMSPVAAFTASMPATTPYPLTARWNLADIDGDGRNDYVFAGGTQMSSATIQYRLSRVDGAFGPAVNTGIPCPTGIGMPFDANGDGRMDFLMGANGRWAIVRGSATGLGALVDTGIALPAGTRDFRGADINGDGLGDIVWSQVPVNDTLRVRAQLAKPAGGYGAPVTLYSQWDTVGYEQPEGGDFIGYPGRRVDLDGDGDEELLMHENYTVARISASGFATDRPDNVFRGGVPLDFNDDGCTDLAYKHLSSQTLRVRLSACTVNAPTSELLGPAWTSGFEPEALDWNGDGRDDVLLRGTTNWLVALSLGDAVAPFLDTGTPHEGAAAIAGRDLDGDGLDDIALKASTQIRARFRTGPMPDLLTSATDGFGVTAIFAFRPLTDAAVHAAGASAGWPDPHLQTNDLVVSQLSTTDGTGKGYRSTTEFRYEGLRGNLQGRGSLGFGKVIRAESRGEGLRSMLTRRQDYPFTGLPQSLVVQQPNGREVASTGYSWSKLDIGPTLQRRLYPYPSSITTRRFEVGGSLDGAEIARSVRAIAAIDVTSGLVTDETRTTTEMAGGVNTGSSSSLRIQNSDLLNDTPNWCLGRSQAVEITASHTLPGGAPIVRTADQAWDGAKCRPTRIRLFPGDSHWQVIHDLGYDGFGNVTSEKVTGAGMAARTVTTQWDARGRLPVQVANPLSQAVRYAWDEARGQPLAFTDPNGVAMTWAYDTFGQPVRETQPDGTATRWSREACKGTCDTRVKYRLRQDDLDSAGAVKLTTWFDVDQHDRGFRAQSMQPGGAYAGATVDFDTKGRIARHELPHWTGSQPHGSRSFEYDMLGRLVSDRLSAVGGSVSGSVTLSHDGLAMMQTDSLGRVTTGTRIAWGPLSEMVDALGERTRYEYDAFGGLLRVRDALGDTVSSISYNPRGFKLAVDDSDRGAWTWTRNALGEVTALRDAKGTVSQFTYDALGRVTQRTNADGTAKWTWGASAAGRNIGRLAALSGPGYSESFAYDGAGRPATHTITSDAPYRFDFSYNALGLLEILTYPSAGAGERFWIAHFYDAGRVTQIQSANNAAGTIWTLNTQDAAGNVLDETLGASVRVVSGFSPLTGDLEYRQTRDGGSATIQDLAYGWDAAGNLSGRRDLIQGLREDFHYDALDRLVQSRRNGTVNLELDYDPIGNIRRKSDVCSGTGSCYTYHAARKHAVVSVGGRKYAYDANGNMTKRKGMAIAWSADNLPLAIVGSGGSRSDFSYGPDGNRWRQAARYGTTTETTTYAGGLFEKVTNAGQTTWRHYVPAPGGTALHLRHGNGAAAETRFLTLDHLGSTDRVVDADGNVIVAESFGALGARRRPAWTGIPTAADLAKIAAATRDGFTGHEMLDNLGLVHMNGRVYDPEIGRFISADPYVTLPYDSQGLNRYAYTLNNPLAFTDPSGFDPVPCLATQSGNCVQITVIAVSWPDYMRSIGGAHASEVASALERDPCGHNGSGACYVPSFAYDAPSTTVLTVGKQPDPTLSTGGRLDAVQGFAARIANLAISSSPIAMLFGADPDFQYFREPNSDAGRMGSGAGNVGYLLGGAAGIIRKGGTEIVRSPSQFARSMQGNDDFPGIDRFKDIVLKKGTIVYAGFPGQGAFYTTRSALRRVGKSASGFNKGLQIAPHRTRPPRSRYAAYEVIDDTPAAFALTIANPQHGPGRLPQVVVPSWQSTLHLLDDFPLGP